MLGTYSSVLNWINVFVWLILYVIDPFYLLFTSYQLIGLHTILKIGKFDLILKTMFKKIYKLKEMLFN